MEVCSYCGKSGDEKSIRRCSRCKAVRYCSSDCQKRDWLRHKVTCKEDPSTSNGGTGKDQATSLGQGAPGESLTVDGDSHSEVMTCRKCKRQGKGFKKCSKCQKVTYCSPDCQRGDWKDHKATCKSVSYVTNNGVGLGEATAQGATATPQKTEQPTSQRDTNRWANLFGTLYQDPWEDARSRAVAAFPGNRVTDVFRGLEMTFDLNVASVPVMPFMPFMPFMPMPFLPFMPFMPPALPYYRGVSDAILVVKAVSRFVLPSVIPVHGWLVEDSRGNRTQVVFGTVARSGPHFRDEEVEEGHFLCVRHPQVVMFDHGGAQGHFVMVEDIDTIRAFTS